MNQSKPVTTDTRPQTLLSAENDRTEGGFSPVFFWVLEFFFWFSVFIAISLAGGLTLLQRLLIPTVLSGFGLLLGAYLFQNYSVKVTNKTVYWRSAIIPGIWAETWEEPLENFSALRVRVSKPVSDFFPPKYCSGTYGIPVKKNSSRTTSKAWEFNKKDFKIVYLEHKSNPEKNVFLKFFEITDQEKLDQYLDYAGKKLGLKAF